MKKEKQSTVQINLSITKNDNFFVCHDLTTLQIIMGTKAVSGNLHIYDITKEHGYYYVPIETVRKRFEELTEKKKKLDETIRIIAQILI